MMKAIISCGLFLCLPILGYSNDLLLDTLPNSSQMPRSEVDPFGDQRADTTATRIRPLQMPLQNTIVDSTRVLEPVQMPAGIELSNSPQIPTPRDSTQVSSESKDPCAESFALEELKDPRSPARAMGSRERHYRGKLETQQQKLIDSQRRYCEAHNLLGGFITDELRARAVFLQQVDLSYERIGPLKQGMELRISSIFPKNMKEPQRQIVTKKIMAAMVEALIRFEKTGAINYQESNTLVQIELIAGKQEWINEVEQKLGALHVYTTPQLLSGEFTSVLITFESIDIFLTDYKQFQIKKLKTQKEIEALQELLKKD